MGRCAAASCMHARCNGGVPHTCARACTHAQSRTHSLTHSTHARTQTRASTKETRTYRRAWAHAHARMPTLARARAHTQTHKHTHTHTTARVRARAHAPTRTHMPWPKSLRGLGDSTCGQVPVGAPWHPARTHARARTRSHLLKAGGGLLVVVIGDGHVHRLCIASARGPRLPHGPPIPAGTFVTDLATAS
jgi:hypothetical protein